MAFFHVYDHHCSMVRDPCYHMYSECFRFILYLILAVITQAKSANESMRKAAPMEVYLKSRANIRPGYIISRNRKIHNLPKINIVSSLSLSLSHHAELEVAHLDLVQESLPSPDNAT